MGGFELIKNLVKGSATPDQVFGNEVLYLYALGFSSPTAASKINKLIFMVDKRIFASMLIKKFKGKAYPSWIKKPKKPDDIIQKYCDNNNIKRNEVVEKIISDNYHEFLVEMKADVKTLKKNGFELNKPEKRVENEWF